MRKLTLGLGLCALLAACEKPTPFENTVPATSNPGTGPTPTFDASFPSLDARVAPESDGATAMEPATQPFTQGALLKAIGDCALDRYQRFVTLATTLRDATGAFARAPTPDSQAAARAAWVSATALWQELELFRFGPAGSSVEPGGKDLRNNIYFFPGISNCQVDRALTSKRYETAGVSNLTADAKGLGALEYLLFYVGSENSCAQTDSLVNAPGQGGTSSWQQLTADELARRRASYAEAVAVDVLAQASALLQAWQPAQGNFYGQFTTAGAGSTLFPRAYDAFNLIDNSMFYWDRELKDDKVATPAGLSINCNAQTCPDSVEARFSGTSNQAIHGNIVGFRLLFQGCGTNYAGLGFDDWLRFINNGALADKMTAALQAADDAVLALPAPLYVMLTQNLAQVRDLHAKLKAVSDPLKTEFVGSLNLELPTAAQGDND